MILLSTTYFGNIQYYSKLYCGKDVCIELYENYTKQSYRNRCVILGANGTAALSIPVKKDVRLKIPIRDVQIDYDTDWQKQHWRSIYSAYGSSPYFEYYDYLFEPLFKGREKYLLDHNNRCMETVFRCIGETPELRYTESFIDDTPGILDYRGCISPKESKHKEDPYFRDTEYYQVFNDRYGFVPNLSVLDLLFCEGNHTLSFLKKSYVTNEQE